MAYRLFDDILADPNTDWGDKHRPFFEWRDPFSGVDPTKFPRRWCIVGGGVAGLTAAYEIVEFAKLNSIDVSVDVFERADKFGGRIRTHSFSPTCFAEMGPMRIPVGHKVALHYVRSRFKLGLNEFSGTANYFYRGAFHSDWKSIYQRSTLTADHDIAFLVNTFVTTDLLKRGVMTPMDPEAVLVRAMEELLDDEIRDFLFAARHSGGSDADPDDRILDLYRSRPETAWGLGLDSITVREGFDIAVHRWIRTSKLSAPAKREFAQHLWDEVATLQGLNWLEHISCLHFLREGQALTAPHKMQLTGGFHALTGAFESELRRHPELVRLEAGRRVRAIVDAGDCIEVRIDPIEDPGGGSEQRTPQEIRKYDRVICAVPAAAARQIQFSPPMEPRQRAALCGISYLSASKSAVHFKRRWWELDDSGIPGFPKKIGGVTYTDLPNQQIWYPNDNIAAPRDDHDFKDEDPDEFEVVAGSSVEPAPAHQELAAQAVSLATIAAAQRAKSEGEGALLAAYMWGQNADRFASMSESDRTEEIERCLEAVAPGSTREILDIKHVPWTLEPNPAGGAFSWFEPAQQTRYQSVAGAPLWPLPNSRSHRVTFAGEHLGLLQGWLQGAMQSALAALKAST